MPGLDVSHGPTGVVPAYCVFQSHLSNVGEDRCAYVRPMVFANKAMASRANLERQVSVWLDECGTLPPGNGVERDIWEVGTGGKVPLDPALMSPSELAEYEEKKLKMRKAMVSCSCGYLTAHVCMFSLMGN